MQSASTTIDIPAAPALVWQVLTDLDAYEQWNPFIVRASGVVATGERLAVTMQPPRGRAMRFRPEVTAVEPQRVLEWLGHLGVPGVLDGRHRFELQATATGTRVVQSEVFTGILVPLLSRSLDTTTRHGFRAMDEALRERVEALSSTGASWAASGD